MATSGRATGNSVTIGGNGGNYIFTDWQLASQSVAGNYSVINWQTYMHYNSADAQLDNGYTDVGGRVWTNGGRVYNYAGNFTTRDMALASGQTTVYHDSAGNYTLGVNCGVQPIGVGYTGTSGSTWALTTIPRYTSYTSGPTTSNITTTGWDINVQTANTCDNLAIAIDGGGWTYYTGDFTNKTVSVGGTLASGAIHTYKTSVRRKDSQLWTESGYITVTTLSGGTGPAGTWTQRASADLTFATWKTTGFTYAEFTNIDPSDMIKIIMDDYLNNGGEISYTNESIDQTGITTDYTFNANTLLESIQKCQELAPEGWYWYIDYGTNLLHFHKKNESPDHIFSLEKDVMDAKFEKRIEDIVNTVYFTGGVVASGKNLFKKYENTASIEKYGRKSTKYNDSNVVLESTAETIANAILASKSEPELRVTLEILDSNNDMEMGYDIETIKVGDVVAVRNVSQQVSLSTWDVARWDEAYWDYNIQNLSTLQMQVQRIDYSADRAIITASTMATDISKRVESINKDVQAIQTLNNPEQPT